MKQFKFTLEKFHAIKINHQDSLKQMIESVDKKIRDISSVLDSLENAMNVEREKYAADCAKGTTPGKLREYDAYFTHIAEQIQLQREKLAKMEAEAAELRARIVIVNNEIKILEKKREEQYKVFLEQVAAEEARELDDFISFKISAR